MRCLFIMDDHPLSRDVRGGTPVVMLSHFELLEHWGAELHLLLLRQAGRSLGFDEHVRAERKDWNAIRSRCASDQLLELRSRALPGGPVAGTKRFVSAVRDPYSQFAIAEDESNADAVARVVESIEPDLVWTENLTPATVARRATNGVPMVYGHHDWIWRILQLNRVPWMRGPRGPVNGRLLRRAEELLVREVSGCASPSASEAAELACLNNHVAYLPATYPEPTEALPASVPSPPRIVHVGGMTTLASRVGLERFLEVVWPRLRTASDPLPELLVLGTMDGAGEPLQARLAAVGATCTGFVRDLDSLLRPYDVHVIPWEHPTGARTRLPLALRHGQVVVSTRAAVEGSTELVDGVNCVLVDSLEEMAPAIGLLLRDDARRREIGRSARDTFVAHFTREGVQPRFDAFMNGLARASSSGG